jgi:tRNA-modifying protein YgfZ
MNTQIGHGGMVPLTHWGLIRARGADAVKFLQGQLTNDVATMELSQVRLAGFCSAKGRLQASFVVWKLSADELLLACAASVLAATLKRLSMFVMRAQCKLTDASAELALYGAVDDSARALLGDTPVWSRRDADCGTLVRLPDVGGRPRCMLALPPLAHAQAELSLDAWRVLEVQSGIALIEAATVDKFVPQMLNYELIGGVDFQKGCYPGQEVVARSQYRGTIKRRMFFFDCNGPASAGQEVFHESDPDQPAGMVVNAAPLPDGMRWATLVEVKLAAMDGGSLRLTGSAAAILEPGVLPYPVPIDTVPAD